GLLGAVLGRLRGLSLLDVGRDDVLSDGDEPPALEERVEVRQPVVGLGQIAGPARLVVRVEVGPRLVVRDLVHAREDLLAARESATLVVKHALGVVVDRLPGALAHAPAVGRRVRDPPDLGVWPLVEPSDLRHQLLLSPLRTTNPAARALSTMLCKL